MADQTPQKKLGAARTPPAPVRKPNASAAALAGDRLVPPSVANGKGIDPYTTKRDHHSFETRLDRIDLEPDDATLRGDDAGPVFDRFVETVKAAGRILVPILVRQPEEDGTGKPRLPGTERLILVDGRRRYRAAERLGFPMVPVKNLGPMSKARARQIQIIANEGRAQTAKVDLALAIAELCRDGDTVADLETIFGLKAAMLYRYKRVGDALGTLTPAERHHLRVPAVTLKVMHDLVAHYADDRAGYKAAVMQVATIARDRGELEIEEGTSEPSEMSSMHSSGEAGATSSTPARGKGRAAATGARGRPAAFTGSPAPRVTVKENKRRTRVRMIVEWDIQNVLADADAFVRALSEAGVGRLEDLADFYVRKARQLGAKRQRRATRGAAGGHVPIAGTSGDRRETEVTPAAVRREMNAPPRPGPLGVTPLRAAAPLPAPVTRPLDTLTSAPPSVPHGGHGMSPDQEQRVRDAESRALEVAARVRESLKTAGVGVGAMTVGGRPSDVTDDDIAQDLA